MTSKGTPAAGFASSSSLMMLVTASTTGAFLGALISRWWYLSSSKTTEREAVSFNTIFSSSSSTSRVNRATNDTTIPTHIRKEQLSRHELYFGEEGMQQLQKTRICVVGLGGVGSHTVMALARGGIGYLRIIDHDQVTLSSLNRHAVATLADVGIPKAVALQNSMRQICPDPQYLQVDPRVEMYTAETAASLLDYDEDGQLCSWDLVIDAIDDIPTKAHLIQHCLQRNIPVISCMGAGGKSDFTRLCVSDLRSAAKDPLATKLKQTLKQLLAKQHNSITTNNGSMDNYLDDMKKLTVLYNSEKPVVKLADFTASQKAQGVQHFGAVEGMRIRILPVLGTTPSIMGQALAAYALTECGGKPLAQPVTGERVGKNVRNKLFQKLEHREQGIAQHYDPQRVHSRDEPTILTLPDGKQVWIGPLQVDQDDIDYLMQVWRNRCAVTQARLGTIFHLVRWDVSQPSDLHNLVLISAGALQKYDNPSDFLRSWETIPNDVRETIELRLQAIRQVQEF
ncbi:hypothetical protein FisN_8Hh382 [Fistulifera solaris]|uniref:THIF-type NAD/FAD binding fold domain-containing protein n=1 Tax=Fistulifera solaris TaxID=1519565 RepID=A0A1Z5JN25_FISSO|nr:hypothetical protein FisN_8Hh382 [Fistulifera solaris]|eukprot:GAX15316.1 hypothetical protein FisN_8Hh382 [Fistulifera solaris]